MGSFTRREGFSKWVSRAVTWTAREPPLEAQWAASHG